MQWNDDRWAQLAGLADEGGSGLLSEAHHDLDEADPAIDATMGAPGDNPGGTKVTQVPAVQPSAGGDIDFFGLFEDDEDTDAEIAKHNLRGLSTAAGHSPKEAMTQIPAGKSNVDPEAKELAGKSKKSERVIRKQQRLMENKLRKLIREEIKSYMRAKNRSNNVQRSLSDLNDLDLHRGTTGYASGQVHNSSHAYRPRRTGPTLGFLGPGFK